MHILPIVHPVMQDFFRAVIIGNMYSINLFIHCCFSSFCGVSTNKFIELMTSIIMKDFTIDPHDGITKE